ncbi:MAG: tail fiber domain-containing protein [Candidatus Anammoxibacter sp.]
MVKRYLLAGIGVILFGTSSVLFGADTEITLEDNTSDSGFSVKDSSGNTIMRVQGSGNVGIGTTGTTADLELKTDATTTDGMFIDASTITSGNGLHVKVDTTKVTTGYAIKVEDENANALFRVDQWANVYGGQFLPPSGSAGTPGFAFDGSTNMGLFAPTTSALGFSTNGTEHMRIDSSGNVGIGTTAPDQKLSVNGEASKVGGGSWVTFSDVRLKNINSAYDAGLNEIMKLQPIKYNYKADNPLNIPDEGEHVGFSAQAVQKLIPEAVSANSKGFLMLNNDPIMWAMLNAIKEQQAQLEQLKAELVKFKNEKL